MRLKPLVLSPLLKEVFTARRISDIARRMVVLPEALAPKMQAAGSAPTGFFNPASFKSRRASSSAKRVATMENSVSLR